jgi:hypothetical protein
VYEALSYLKLLVYEALRSAVFFGPDFVTVTKSSDELSWGEMKPEIFAGAPCLSVSVAVAVAVSASVAYLYICVLIPLYMCPHTSIAVC